MFINKEYILNKYWKKKQPILKRMHNKILLCEKYTLNGHTEEDNSLDINKLIFRGYRDII